MSRLKYNSSKGYTSFVLNLNHPIILVRFLFYLFPFFFLCGRVVWSKNNIFFVTVFPAWKLES